MMIANFFKSNYPGTPTGENEPSLTLATPGSADSNASTTEVDDKERSDETSTPRKKLVNDFEEVTLYAKSKEAVERNSLGGIEEERTEVGAVVVVDDESEQEKEKEIVAEVDLEDEKTLGRFITVYTFRAIKGRESTTCLLHHLAFESTLTTKYEDPSSEEYSNLVSLVQKIAKVEVDDMHRCIGHLQNLCQYRKEKITNTNSDEASEDRPLKLIKSKTQELEECVEWRLDLIAFLWLFRHAANVERKRSKKEKKKLHLCVRLLLQDYKNVLTKAGYAEDFVLQLQDWGDKLNKAYDQYDEALIANEDFMTKDTTNKAGRDLEASLVNLAHDDANKRLFYLKAIRYRILRAAPYPSFVLRLDQLDEK